MHARSARTVAALAAGSMLTVLAACGGGGGSSLVLGTTAVPRTTPATTTATTTEAPTTDATTTEAPTTVADTVAEPEVVPVVGKQGDIIIRETVADLNAWWTRTFPTLYPGRKYSPPVAGAWTLKAGETVDCGDLTVTWDDVRNNAYWVPCDDDTDIVLFDLELLIPDLATNSGQFAPAFVAAHEWGHLVQNRGRESNKVSVNTELQADCYAGAYVSHIIADGTPFEITADDIDTALSALISISDAPGSDAAGAQAHGSAFDRVSAFADGLADIRSCLTYQTDPPPVFELPFTNFQDEATGGNLEIFKLFDLANRDLSTFFLTEVSPNYPLPPFPADVPCDGAYLLLAYCPSIGQIVYDGTRLGALHEYLGDFAVVVLLARAYTSTVDSSKQVGNCVTGAFARALILADADQTGQYNLVLSPGDLDEAVRVFLIESEDGDGIVNVASMRQGLLQGISAC